MTYRRSAVERAESARQRLVLVGQGATSFHLSWYPVLDFNDFNNSLSDVNENCSRSLVPFWHFVFAGAFFRKIDILLKRRLRTVSSIPPSSVGPIGQKMPL